MSIKGTYYGLSFISRLNLSDDKEYCLLPFYGV